MKKKLILPLVVAMFFNIVPTYANDLDFTENTNINSINESNLLSRSIIKADNINNGKVEDAINLGYWGNPGTTTVDITIKEDPNNKANTNVYFKFKVYAGEKIYLSSNVNDVVNGGATITLVDKYGKELGKSYDSSDAIQGKYSKFIAIDYDCKKDEEIYFKVSKGTNTFKDTSLSISIYDRIKKGKSTFKINDTITNNGAGYSTTATFDLTNDKSIPAYATTTKVETKGYQSPSQGHVTHMISPQSSGTWYSSKYTSDSSGSFDIPETPVAQKWYFKYNAKAWGQSKMNKLELKVDWQYDLSKTNYQ